MYPWTEESLRIMAKNIYSKEHRSWLKDYERPARKEVSTKNTMLMIRVAILWAGEVTSKKRASKNATPWRCFTLNDIRTRPNKRRMLMKVGI